MQLYHRYLPAAVPSTKTIIILHGLLGSSDNWLTLAKYLTSDYNVYLLDQRNHGQSNWADKWDYEAMEQDLLEFLKTQNLQSIILIGHSMGGKTAMFFASKNPTYLSHLIIVDIAPKYYAPHHQNILDGLNSIKLSAVTSRQEADEVLASYVFSLDTRQFLLKNLYRNTEGKFAWRINLSLITNQIEHIGEALPNDAVFFGKTLFVRGSKSDYIQIPVDEALIYTHFPHAQLATVENAGHWVQAEQPQAFLLVIKKFLNL